MRSRFKDRTASGRLRLPDRSAGPDGPADGAMAVLLAVFAEFEPGDSARTGARRLGPRPAERQEAGLTHNSGGPLCDGLVAGGHDAAWCSRSCGTPAPALMLRLFVPRAYAGSSSRAASSSPQAGRGPERRKGFVTVTIPTTTLHPSATWSRQALRRSGRDERSPLPPRPKPWVQR